MASTGSRLASPDVRSWLDEERERIVADLMLLAEVDSSSPHEERLFPLLERLLDEAGAAPRVLPVAGVASRPGFVDSGFRHLLADRRLLRAHVAGEPTGPRTLFNAHLDVVPAGGWPEAFRPRYVGGSVYGRGTADTKGNIVMLLAALRFMRDTGRALAGPVEIDFVFEEELGGNGTRASVLLGTAADQAVVLEPTGLAVHNGHRGCLSFRLRVRTPAAHMGFTGTTPSAIDVAFEATRALKRLEQRMLAEAATDRDFGSWERPVQLVVSSIAGGEWHGSVPGACELRGNLGFLPSRSLADAEALLRGVAEELSPATVAVDFPLLRNDAYLGDPSSPLVRRLTAACEQPPPRPWLVSCDARLYARAGIPTVVFGCGRLEHAHTHGEHVSIAELERGVAVLARFLEHGWDA
jgi:acetylornithine deacetylase